LPKSSPASSRSDVGDLVPLVSVPAGANVMHCHFVFAIKRKADGSTDKFKARLVADGSTQKHWVDFNRVFATVVKALTIRLVLAIAAARDYNLTSLDIRQAYLQATIDEDLYMRAPPGINSRGGELVCKLRRSLYGLKQAGREWARLLARVLVALNGCPGYSGHDPGVNTSITDESAPDSRTHRAAARATVFV